MNEPLYMIKKKKPNTLFELKKKHLSLTQIVTSAIVRDMTNLCISFYADGIFVKSPSYINFNDKIKKSLCSSLDELISDYVPRPLSTYKDTNINLDLMNLSKRFKN